MKPSKYIPRMKQDFFRYLPSEIIIDILSRLPIRTIASSKCVCKPWLHLLETDEFVNSHLAKSAPMLAYCTHRLDGTPFSQSCTIFEFEDGLDLTHHDLHYNPFIEFDFPHNAMIQGSANGLLLLHKPYYPKHPYNSLYVCNPITRDFIKLHYPKEFKCEYQQVVTFGFGVSKITGQYKVVRIFNGPPINAKYECHVHTLRTESWRSIEPVALFKYKETPVFGALLNGNLHWIVSDSNETTWISVFDLETEHFNTFATPPLGGSELLVGLSALGDQLCFCDNTYEDEFVIWLMKDYGVDKSWTKQYVIGKDPIYYGADYEYVAPIKVFRDGDILMYYDDYFLLYYSSKTNTTKQSHIFEMHLINAILLTPSFVSLKTFGMENVISF